MTTTVSDLPVEDRIHQVLDHWGIRQAHFAARGGEDWRGLAARYPEAIASLTLVCPRVIDPAAHHLSASRILLVNADQGAFTETLERSLTGFPEIASVTLRNYASHTQSDVAADRTGEVQVALLDFLAQADQDGIPAAPANLPPEAEVSGITCRIRGSGPPLVLLPLWYAPSQWEPLLPVLSQRYCTITLGGPFVGRVAVLDNRGRAPGYLGVMGTLLEHLELQPGQRVLDLGCGTGAVDRWLAHRTGGANPITALDLNPYTLREAEYLARQEGLSDVVQFREGNGEALPFPDDAFDAVIATTVIEHGNADRMLQEMVRVTRPGGRVGVVVRAEDRPYLVNLPLRPELKTRAESPGGGRPGVDPQGCADASLYRRVRRAGLDPVRMFPHLAAYDDRANLENYQGYILPILSPAEVQEWREAVARAESEGTFFIATPFHCAVGVRPG